MNDKKYEQLEINKGGIRMVMEFPKNTGNEETIKKEVKDILSNLLEETISKSPPLQTKGGGTTI